MLIVEEILSKEFMVDKLDSKSLTLLSLKDNL